MLFCLTSSLIGVCSMIYAERYSSSHSLHFNEGQSCFTKDRTEEKAPQNRKRAIEKRSTFLDKFKSCRGSDSSFNREGRRKRYDLNLLNNWATRQIAKLNLMTLVQPSVNVGNSTPAFSFTTLFKRRLRMCSQEKKLTSNDHLMKALEMVTQEYKDIYLKLHHRKFKSQEPEIDVPRPFSRNLCIIYALLQIQIKTDYLKHRDSLL